jgi:hypothetical protein
MDNLMSFIAPVFVFFACRAPVGEKFIGVDERGDGGEFIDEVGLVTLQTLRELSGSVAPQRNGAPPEDDVRVVFAQRTEFLCYDEKLDGCVPV